MAALLDPSQPSLIFPPPPPFISTRAAETGRKKYLFLDVFCNVRFEAKVLRRMFWCRVWRCLSPLFFQPLQSVTRCRAPPTDNCKPTCHRYSKPTGAHQCPHLEPMHVLLTFNISWLRHRPWQQRNGSANNPRFRSYAGIRATTFPR